ncbi:hypothetical protein BKA70DRAFT_1395888 [Coprinopsis sp. MPI-PUGE-AT-0042]|nr:hypothetical protein BKA70DRAFT_1395888 [Coprinopsis sp. MPI-PUGE-AT-0042]
MSKTENAGTTSVKLSPTAGFCIKSTTLEPGYLPPAADAEPGAAKGGVGPTSGSTNSKSHGGLLEPSSSYEPIPVPVGMKVFVNMAYDSNVPPPPKGSEDAIKRAIQGEEPPEGEESYYVPVIVSHPRQDKDKSGIPSLVVDCVFNSSLKSRVLVDQEFKIFLVVHLLCLFLLPVLRPILGKIVQCASPPLSFSSLWTELALQRIEAQTGLTLSRKIGRPNIAAKGKLKPRTVRIPTVLLQGADSLGEDEAPKAAIIEAKREAKEVKGILKKSGTNEKAPAKAKKPAVEVISSTEVQENEADENYDWYESSWDWERVGDKIEIRVKIQGLPTSNVRTALTTLDIEPRRLILTLSPIQTLDLNRMKADGDIVTSLHKEARYRAKHIARLRKSKLEKDADEVKTYEDLIQQVEKEELAKTDKEVSQLLLLKRERPFDVDGCQAEWRVGEDGRGELIVTC